MYGLTLCPHILKRCSLFAHSPTPEVAGQHCRILGLVVFLVLSLHSKAETEVQRQPVCPDGLWILDLPPAASCCLQCWFFPGIVFLQFKNTLKPPRLLFSHPLLSSSKRKTLLSWTCLHGAEPYRMGD